MNKLLLKIFVLILIYNNSHSITCDDILEKTNELDKDSQKVLVINYSTEKIIILKGTTNYLAYIGNINAVVNYIQCSEFNDNSLLFTNIEDKSVLYSLQLSKGIKDLTLEIKFNPIDHITDENKLKQIHNIFSKSNIQKYITSPHEIERLFDAHHNDYNLGFSNHQEYNILADVSSEHSNFDSSGKVPYHLLDDKVLSDNISTDLLDENNITGYSYFPHADVTTKNIESTNAVEISENPRLIKRKLKKEGESGAKRQRLNTHDEKASAHLEELRFGDLPDKLRYFIEKKGEFKDQFDILYLIYPAENLPLDKFIINNHMNEILEQLKSGENLILLNKDLAMDQIKNTKFSNLKTIFIVIKKIDDFYYDISTFSIRKSDNEIISAGESLKKKIYFKNRNNNNHKVEFTLAAINLHLNVDDFYIIGSLRIKKKVDEIETQLQSQSSTDNADKESIVLQKGHSLKDILDTEFTGNNYYIDEEYNKLLLLESRVKYLKDNIITSNRENLFVLIQKQFSVDGNNNLITSFDKKVGIILKKKYLTGINDTSFKVEFIRQGSSASIYFIENTDISGKVSFYIENKSLMLYNRHNEKRNRLNLNNYYLIRKLL